MWGIVCGGVCIVGFDFGGMDEKFYRVRSTTSWDIRLRVSKGGGN